MLGQGRRAPCRALSRPISGSDADAAYQKRYYEVYMKNALFMAQVRRANAPEVGDWLCSWLDEHIIGAPAASLSRQYAMLE